MSARGVLFRLILVSLFWGVVYALRRVPELCYAPGDVVAVRWDEYFVRAARGRRSMRFGKDVFRARGFIYLFSTGWEPDCQITMTGNEGNNFILLAGVGCRKLSFLRLETFEDVYGRFRLDWQISAHLVTTTKYVPTTQRLRIQAFRHTWFMSSLFCYKIVFHSRINSIVTTI